MSTRMRDKLLNSPALNSPAPNSPALTFSTWRRLAAAAAVAATVVVSGPAHAQHVAVIVNGSPITTYDIDQRIKFTTIATHKTPNRQEIIEELIDEKLKVQIGLRYKLEVTDREVDTALGNMSQRMRMSPQQLVAALAQSGIDAQTLKAKIRADIAWQQIVRGKFQSSLQVNDKAVNDKLKINNQDDKKEVGYEYTLRPILFLTNGATEGALDARKRDAEGLKVRFQNCTDGLRFASALRDVAIREQIVKSSADLPAAQRKMLDELEVGKLSSPEVTPQGIQMFALCSRTEKKVDGAAAKEARDALFTEQFQAKSKRFLADLRKQAMIEVK
jgi:peptidyl-prolyl cis-trans isomerase SurA